MEPWPHGDLTTETTRFIDQDEKSRLECVLGVVRVLQNAPANAQHHWTVSCHQGLERNDVMPGDKTLEQLRIG